MKYLSKSFSTPANSKAYVDNWESVFSGRDDESTTQIENAIYDLASRAMPVRSCRSCGRRWSTASGPGTLTCLDCGVETGFDS